MAEAVEAAALVARGMEWPRRDWALLDVRDVGEYERGHVPGATSLPRRMLEFRAGEVMPDRGWPVVVYDSGRPGDLRAMLAAERLGEMGYGRVEVLARGQLGWTAEGRALAKGVNVPCKRFGEEVLEGGEVTLVAPEALMREGVEVLCDVRTAGEFADHHLGGALSLPGFELAGHLPGLARRHGRIVLNCAGRTRSIIAAATARALGYDCAALENGTMGWRLAGGEVERGAGGDVPDAVEADVAGVTARARELAVSMGVVAVPANELAGCRAEAGVARPYVLDVRTREAFEAGHVPGAIHLPGGQAIQRTDDFLAVPGAPVAVVDDGDARAWLAAWWLKRMGFAGVAVLEGGMPAWRAAGLDVEAGRGRVRPAVIDRLVADVPVVSCDALRKRGAAPVVIDVGSSRAYAKGHLPEAIWISRGWLEHEIRRHASPGDEIVVTAGDPVQAKLGAEVLLRAGYRRAVALDAGLDEWQAMGGAVETGPVPAHAMDVVEPPYAKGEAAMREYLEWEIRLTAGDVNEREGSLT
ncbi:MAG: rhodanese-like domain-containing protein [Roseovarius sp.]|uniref:rhodanese-like domain-containing protein n=1 Tax=Roseovarius sp. TaxID=1486281 RepID=UPI0032EE1117